MTTTTTSEALANAAEKSNENEMFSKVATCTFCGRPCDDGRLVPYRYGLHPGCAPQCPAAYVAQAVAYEVLVLGLPCARRWPLEAHLEGRVTPEGLTEALLTLERMGIVERDGDAETTWGWRLAEVSP